MELTDGYGVGEMCSGARGQTLIPWPNRLRDGRYLWVGDDGDVISTRTNRVIAYVQALANSRYVFELDWRGASAVRTSSRSGIAYDRR
jgi:hypothetical protein